MPRRTSTTTTSLTEFKARLSRLDRLREPFGAGLSYDDACVRSYDRLLRQIVARGGSARAHVLDRMIAATALAHGMALVTRDGPGVANRDGLVTVDAR